MEDPGARSGACGRYACNGLSEGHFAFECELRGEALHSWGTSLLPHHGPAHAAACGGDAASFHHRCFGDGERCSLERAVCQETRRERTMDEGASARFCAG